MCPTILLLAHHLTLAVLPEQHRIYDRLCREYYWPNVLTDVYSRVQHGQECLEMETKFKHQRQIQLFLTSGRREFITIDIIGPLPRTSLGNQIVILITDQYSEIARPVPTPSRLSNHVTGIFLNQLKIAHGFPDITLFKFWAVICQLVSHLVMQISWS